MGTTTLNRGTVLKSLTFLVILAFLVILSAQGTARAATLTVSNLNDSGAGSLRQAIADASPGDTITFGVTGTIVLTSGRLTITKDLTIAGPGAASLAVSGSNASQVVGVFGAGVTVTISDVTISGGNTSSGQGGGIENQTTLTLTDSIVTGNNARLGGGIFNSGTLTLTRSTVSGNTDSQTGAGFYINGGTTNLTDSTVSGNASTSLGGGFYISSGTVNLTRSTVSGNTGTRGGGFENRGTVNLTNSTVSGNSATSGIAGGIFVSTGSLVVVNSTITGNSASGEGGGIFDGSISGITSLVNTIIASNTASAGPDCFSASVAGFLGPVISLGHNLVGNNSGCTYTTITTGDLMGTFSTPINPLLGPLAGNGGPTMTHALLTGSPAIDAGDDSAAPATDQRGVSRPQGAASDIGAFEAGASTTAWTDCTEALYVANEGNGGGGTRIMRIDCNGNITTFATGFDGPSGLVADGTHLYISDDSPGLWKVDGAGTVAPIATSVSFGNPNGLALDSSGRLLVADAGTGEVRRLTLDAGGNVTNNELVASGLSNPQGVVVAPTSGDILFTDQTGNVFTAPDSLSTVTTLSLVSVVSGNQGSIKVDPSGNIFVGNSGGRIVRLDPTGTTARYLVVIPHVSCPAGQAAMDGQPGFRGMTFSPDGDLVVTGYCLDNVYIFPQADLDAAWATSTPITTLPAPFAQNPSGALDSPFLNGPFAMAFFGEGVPPLAKACVLPAGGNVVYVDATSSAGSPNGSLSAPYLTIQAAVDAASAGDIIRVADGNYPENITISKSELHLVGTGPARAVIDASPGGLSGVTITQSAHAVTLANFRFTNADNQGSGFVAGIIIYGSAEPQPRGIEVCNNVFVDNEAGIAAQNTAPTVVNNTFVQNTTAGVSTSLRSEAVIRNNIFQGNAKGIDTTGTSAAANIVNDHNLFFNNTINVNSSVSCSPGCIFAADPLLSNVSAHDYHLTTGSLAIDTGSATLAPADDFDGGTRPVDGDGNASVITDIGADEFGLGQSTQVPGLGVWGMLGLTAVMGAALVLFILFPGMLGRNKRTA